MSTIKAPPEKKRLILELDRRNSYGENDKSSRKNIPRSKARSHRDERRSVAQALLGVFASSSAEAVDARARSTARQKKVAAFKKSPDQPLAAHVLEQSVRRTKRGKHA